MLGVTEKYNQFKKSTYFPGGKFVISATCILLVAALAAGCLGTVIGSPLLTFPLAMLISNPVVWVLMGIVVTAAYKMVVEPLFYLAKNYINGKGASKGEKSEEKSPEQEQTVANQERPKTPDRDSGIGDDISIGSTENKQSKQTKIVTCDTAGAGNNCFFHSVFGQNNSGTYRAEKAQEMRLEWHKFLSQFEHLDDYKMSNALIKQMQTIFTMFLDRPQDLTGKSDEIKRLVEQTNNKIKEADSETEKLKEEIVKNFRDNGDFRKVIYPIIERAINQRNKRNIASPRDQKTLLSVEDLLKEENRERLYNDIAEDLEYCALILNPNLSKREYGNTYDPNVIKDSFINDENVYKAYREAIRGSYCVFIEEIPILASLADIEITVHHQNNGNNVHTVFEPNPEIIEVSNLNTSSVEVYQRNSELWGDKRQDTIYLKPGHYERAKVVEVEPSLMEKVSSAIQSVVTVCVNALGLNT